MYSAKLSYVLLAVVSLVFYSTASVAQIQDQYAVLLEERTLPLFSDLSWTVAKPLTQAYSPSNVSEDVTVQVKNAQGSVLEEKVFKIRAKTSADTHKLLRSFINSHMKYVKVGAVLTEDRLSTASAIENNKIYLGGNNLSVNITATAVMQKSARTLRSAGNPKIPAVIFEEASNVTDAHDLCATVQYNIKNTLTDEGFSVSESQAIADKTCQSGSLDLTGVVSSDEKVQSSLLGKYAVFKQENIEDDSYIVYVTTAQGISNGPVAVSNSNGRRAEGMLFGEIKASVKVYGETLPPAGVTPKLIEWTPATNFPGTSSTKIQSTGWSYSLGAGGGVNAAGAEISPSFSISNSTSKTEVTSVEQFYFTPAQDTARANTELKYRESEYKLGLTPLFADYYPTVPIRLDQYTAEQYFPSFTGYVHGYINNVASAKNAPISEGLFSPDLQLIWQIHDVPKNMKMPIEITLSEYFGRKKYMLKVAGGNATYIMESIPTSFLSKYVSGQVNFN